MLSIDTVVVLVMENRSFDHMLGRRPGVNGILDGQGNLKPNCFNIDASTNQQIMAGAAGSFVIPKIDINRQGFGGPSHSFPGCAKQLYGAKTVITPAVTSAAPSLAGYVDSYRTELHKSSITLQELSEPMSTFTPDELPAMNALADNFMVCDNWFSEVPGPTQPNRLFLHAGTAQGFAHNVWKQPFTMPTIYELLEAKGKTWAFYYHDLSDSDSFPALKKRVDRVLAFDQFAEHASAGTLPNYSFLCPRYADKAGQFANSQHAPYDVRNGDALIGQVYNALRSSPQWGSSLLIITYDEGGGYYDHAVPPYLNVTPPDQYTSPTAYDKQLASKGTRNAYLLKPDMEFGFDRLGQRVPAIIVSPFAPKTPCQVALQHTSIFATMRDIFGIGSLTKRDARAASFYTCLLQTARSDLPISVPVYGVDTPTPQTMALPPTEMQTEKFPQLANLDGHADSGTVPTVPPTRQRLADYIDERRRAHNAFHAHQVTQKVDADEHGQFRWHLMNKTGDVLQSSHPYLEQTDAEAAGRRIMKAKRPAAAKTMAPAPAPAAVVAKKATPAKKSQAKAKAAPGKKRSGSK